MRGSVAGNSIEVSGSTRNTGWACEWACKRSGFAHRPSLADSAPVYRRAQPTAAARQGAACTGRRERRAAKRRAVRGGIVGSTACGNKVAENISRRRKHPRFGDRRQEQQQAHARRPSQQRPLSDTAQRTSVNVSTKKKEQSMSLQGQLTTIPCGPFFYPVFTSGDLTANRAVVFIGGLTNGLGAVPFTYPLSDALRKAGWKL